jgi:hypothetical protein
MRSSTAAGVSGLSISFGLRHKNKRHTSTKNVHKKVDFDEPIAVIHEIPAIGPFDFEMHEILFFQDEELIQFRADYILELRGRGGEAEISQRSSIYTTIRPEGCCMCFGRKKEKLVDSGSRRKLHRKTPHLILTTPTIGAQKKNNRMSSKKLAARESEESETPRSRLGRMKTHTEEDEDEDDEAEQPNRSSKGRLGRMKTHRTEADGEEDEAVVVIDNGDQIEIEMKVMDATENILIQGYVF